MYIVRMRQKYMLNRSEYSSIYEMYKDLTWIE